MKSKVPVSSAGISSSRNFLMKEKKERRKSQSTVENHVSKIVTASVVWVEDTILQY